MTRPIYIRLLSRILSRIIEDNKLAISLIYPASDWEWDFKLYPEMAKKKVRALGIWLSTNPDVSISLNCKENSGSHNCLFCNRLTT